MGILSN